MKYLITLLTILFFTPCINATEYIYILNDKCINELYKQSTKHFKNSKIKTLRDSRGIILRFFIENIETEIYNTSIESYEKIKFIENFLAKIENPVIIEVHTGDSEKKHPFKLKKWEITTILANRYEDLITKPNGKISQERINSVGYGEFLPAKNTPNNGGKNLDRVDIIILCNVSGE